MEYDDNSAGYDYDADHLYIVLCNGIFEDVMMQLGQAVVASYIHACSYMFIGSAPASGGSSL